MLCLSEMEVQVQGGWGGMVWRPLGTPFSRPARCFLPSGLLHPLFCAICASSVETLLQATICNLLEAAKGLGMSPSVPSAPGRPLFAHFAY